MKRMYISLPMKGQEDTIKERVESALQFIERNYSSYTPVLPCNIEQFTGDDIKIERDQSYEWYIAEDIKLLMSCDSMLLTSGWQNSKGCRIEKAVAEEVGIKIFYK